MVLHNRILYIFALAILLASCSTKKNTVVSRAYHNLTARYNGYYYSNVNIDDGVYKIEKANKDNYEKVLPIYIYPTTEKAKTTFPEFDKAIKKSSLCIQKHAIKDRKNNEIASAGNWIDNNWINIGVAHFYKREFFSGIESFEYVIRTYTKSKDKFTAMIWLTKANNEIGSVSSSEQTLSFLKNERHLPKQVKLELPVVYADYYMRRGQNTEAIARLLEVVRNSNPLSALPRKRRARYAFIVAQLSEQNKDNKRAIQYYKKTIKLKPNYEMVFYSKIKMARLLDVKRNDSYKTKKDLLKMTKEFKNTEYYDVIFYTLGEIEEKERNLNRALLYYKQSVKTSVANANQKAQSFLKLGEINFDLANYPAAEAYYDSTIATLPKDHPDYNSILARKKTLETLVGYIKTISREDSLQRIAKMSDSERDRYVEKMIDNMKRDEALKLKEMEDLANNPPPGGNPLATSSDPITLGSAPVSFPFYNPSTVAFGIADFQKRWGNRKLEDNWRRSNKAVIIDDSNPDKVDSVKKTTVVASAVKSKEFYMKGLPLSDSLMDRSNAKLVKAYYMMGSIYKEELNNNKKAITAFEDLNTRFPDNKYALKSYYVLYRTFMAEKNQPKADYYKNKILNEFPDSEFALLIKNPDYAQELSAVKGEVEIYYRDVYAAYHVDDYQNAYTLASRGITRFGKNDYLPKFEFIKAMSIGRLKGVDTLENNLKLLVAKYPNADVATLANNVLLAIKKQKNPDLFKPVSNKTATDTFNVNPDSEHFVIAVTPDNTKIADGFKITIGNFNSTYYSDRKFTINSNLFGTGSQLIVVKPFTDSKEAMSYYNNFISDPDTFKGDAKKESVDVFVISSDNLPLLYKNKNVKGYKLFFEDNYKKQTVKKIN